MGEFGVLYIVNYGLDWTGLESAFVNCFQV